MKASGKDWKGKEGRVRGEEGGQGSRGSLPNATNRRPVRASRPVTRPRREQGANRSKETREFANKEQTKRKKLESLRKKEQTDRKTLDNLRTQGANCSIEMRAFENKE